MGMVTIIQICVLVQQLQHTQTQASLSRVSLVTLGVQTVFDSYSCLLHLTVGILVEPLFMSFVASAFFMLLHFAVFELRYMLLIWKAQRPDAFSSGWDVIRQEISIL